MEKHPILLLPYETFIWNVTRDLHCVTSRRKHCEVFRVGEKIEEKLDGSTVSCEDICEDACHGKRVQMKMRRR